MKEREEQVRHYEWMAETERSRGVTCDDHTLALVHFALARAYAEKASDLARRAI